MATPAYLLIYNIVATLAIICIYHGNRNTILSSEMTSTLPKMKFCTSDSVPRVTGLLETAQYLAFTNSSLLRFGDGEFELIFGYEVPFQKPDPELSRRLNQAFTSQVPELDIAIPDLFNPSTALSNSILHFFYVTRHYEVKWLLKHVNLNRQYFAAHISSPYVSSIDNRCELISHTYKYLRDIWKDKDIVILRANNGQVYDYDVYDTARSQTILYSIPRGTWAQYEELKSELLKQDPNKLYILAVGLISEILVYDLAVAGRRALDMGHLAKDYDIFMKSGKDVDTFYLDWI